MRLNKFIVIYFHIWGCVCQKQIYKAWINNHIPQILWDVIINYCPRYLPLAHHYIVLCCGTVTMVNLKNPNNAHPFFSVSFHNLFSCSFIWWQNDKYLAVSCQHFDWWIWSPDWYLVEYTYCKLQLKCLLWYIQYCGKEKCVHFSLCQYWMYHNK